MTNIEQQCPSSSIATASVAIGSTSSDASILPVNYDVYLFEHDRTTSSRLNTFHSYEIQTTQTHDEGDDQASLSDRPLRLSRSNDHIEEEDDGELPNQLSSSANEQISATPSFNEHTRIPSTTTDPTSSVPVIVITHEETERRKASTKKTNTSKPTPINMDHITHQSYFNTNSCPNSPVLSNKNLPGNLSPPGSTAVATPHLSVGNKRRGIGHRASYKRAHTGRHSVDHTPNELFIELQELRSDDDNEFYWHECARWIRFEEDFDVEMLRWQAPRVGCLNFHSLLELRRGLQYGIALFDLDEQTLEGIYEAIINDGIANGQMNKDCKDEVLRLLTSEHRHPEPRSSFRRRSSIIDFQPNTGRRPSLAFRKNEQVSVDSTRRMSLLESKINGDIGKGLKNLVVKYDHVDDSLSTQMHSQGNSTEQISNIHTSNESVNQVRLSSVTSHRPSQAPSKKPRDSMPFRSDVLRRIAENAECAEVLVGNIRQLLRPFMAFVRLSQGQLFSNMTEVPLPVKFIFLLIGPATEENFEIGRCLSTLFSTPDFRQIAYQAMDRRDLLNGIHDFLSDSIVLPPGDFDKELLLPVIETAKMKNAKAKRRSTRRKKNRNHSPNEQQNSSSEPTSWHPLGSTHDRQEEDPFMRSGFIFGGVYREMHRRYVHYKSDFLDGFSLHCLVSLIFMFIACLAPALTFGGIIADKTNNRLGVSEMLIASSINGLIFGFVSGQPLLILGPTGPFLVFEEMVFDLCQSLGSDFWTVRCCVSLWTTFFIIMLVAFEGSFMIRHVTRFTEEIFALIIALVYLYEPFKKLYKIFLSNPVRSKYNYDYPLACFCNISSSFNDSLYSNQSSNISFDDSSSSSSSMFSCYDCSIRSHSIVSNENELPNKALLSLIILLGTCFISVALKRFRRSKFFGRTSRQTLSDFGMTIALIVMVLFDMFVTKSAGGHSLTQKITVPDSIRPSDRDRNNIWFISPLRESLPIWVYFASSFPAMLISVVLFFEVELTSIMIQTKLKCVLANKVIKGTGYHLDILIAALLVSISGLFGLPWICAAPVRSIAHVASLSKYSNTHAPGEKARLIDIKDQRLTNIGVHLFIGCTIFAAPIIRKIPVAALFGIFLYFGIVSIPGTQLFSRLKMTFIPTKYHLNVGYLRRVRQMKRNLYTFIQIVAAGLLISIKVTKFAFLFPFILVLLVPFRKWCLPWIFTERELTELDGDEEHRSIFDDEIDFYGQVHMPI